MTPNEKELLTALQNAGTGASVTDILRRNHLATTAEARKKLSSQLCKLREKGLAVSHQQDGVNYWSWTLKGLAELGDLPPDIPAPETPHESPENQSIEPDIVPDISEPELTEADRVAGIRSGQIPTYPLSAVLDIPDSATDRQCRVVYAADDADDINRNLIQESMRIRPVTTGFPRIQDALFVLDTLGSAYCHDLPNYRAELGRIADYLRDAAA